MARELKKWHIRLEGEEGAQNTLSLWGRYEDPANVDSEGNPETGEFGESRTDFASFAASETGSNILSAAKARILTLMNNA